MTAVVFSPSKNVMNVDEVQRKGYAIANTLTWLVLRSPHNAEETYLQNVAGVPMRVLSTFFEQKWLEKGGTRCHTLHSSADLWPGHLSRVCSFLSLCRCGRCTAGHCVSSVTAICDQENFHITVDYRNQEPFFVVLVGKRLLNHELAQPYLTEGDADFTITSPSTDAVFASVHSSSVRSRLDVALLNPYNMTIKYFSLACSFLKTLTECFSNGTMTALAMKVESAPGLNPGQLTLSDPSCGPTYSDDRFAYFHFTVYPCGTTRKAVISNSPLLRRLSTKSCCMRTKSPCQMNLR
ncbi:uncharacterized protein LOC109868687 [Oncorhynchus kisutch]|uniref:uncharacterized protein LOC109868687 n=1 Tax=Oncorhynchus kisutch TaxID=8019 RepID=UPI0012DC34D8|nr:uncharacterized protein LOC109868687 [Oncorhynchus kisutch]